MSADTPDVLKKIVAHKRDEVARRRAHIAPSALRDLPHYGRACRSLRTSVLERPPIGIIAEIKRSSPTAGRMNSVASPSAVAADYEANGAAGCSVLTDERFFSGTLDDLADVSQATALPVLRKDFIINDYQITEAKAYGADAVLLIAAILGRSQLAEYHLAAREHGMETLLELYDPLEIDKLDFSVHQFVGINNRDLRTFQVDLRRSADIAKLLPGEVTVVSESGIGAPADLRFLIEHNISGALIGEYFMRSGTPGAALRRLRESL